MRKEIIVGFENKDLTAYFWDDVKNAKAVVQIIHGMQEHAKRYNDFAKYLNGCGLIVLASDLRGHGLTATTNNTPFGYSDGDIFMEILQDQIVITDYLQKKYNNTKKTRFFSSLVFLLNYLLYLRGKIKLLEYLFHHLHLIFSCVNNVVAIKMC